MSRRSSKSVGGRRDPRIFSLNAVTEGTDAQATVSVRLADQGLVATGKASDSDTLVASARACVHALNELEVRRAKARAALTNAEDEQ